MWREKIEKLSIQIWQSILEAEGVLGAVSRFKIRILKLILRNRIN